ncbi:Plasmodium exported protein, unknown function [Plasmodium sp. gorilla clade G3]|nr:Plasmodium exported protein, unknown function [Plasmodium sp. gorilla clade G3]
MIFFQNKKLYRLITLWILYLINKRYFGRWESKNIDKLIYTVLIPRRILYQFDSENSKVKDRIKFNYSSDQMIENKENINGKNIYQIINETMGKYGTGKYESNERNANNEYVDFKKDKKISKLYDELYTKAKKNVFKKFMNYFNKKYIKYYYKKKIKSIFHKQLKEKKKKLYSLPKGLYFGVIGFLIFIFSIIILKLLIGAKSAFGVTTLPSAMGITFAKSCIVGTLATNGTVSIISNPVVFVILATAILILFIVLIVFLYYFFKEDKNKDDQYDEQVEQQ